MPCATMHKHGSSSHSGLRMRPPAATASGNDPTTVVQGCRRRFAPTLPPQVMRERSSSAGECMLPAALMTTGACKGGGEGGRDSLGLVQDLRRSPGRRLPHQRHWLVPTTRQLQSAAPHLHHQAQRRGAAARQHQHSRRPLAPRVAARRRRGRVGLDKHALRPGACKWEKGKGNKQHTGMSFNLCLLCTAARATHRLLLCTPAAETLERHKAGRPAPAHL